VAGAFAAALAPGVRRCLLLPRKRHGVVRVRVEIMGSQTCGNVGKSQWVLVMINPIISTRTRGTDARDRDLLSLRMQGGFERAFHEVVFAHPRGGECFAAFQHAMALPVPQPQQLELEPEPETERSIELPEPAAPDAAAASSDAGAVGLALIRTRSERERRRR
jgi:hypothetical protein